MANKLLLLAMIMSSATATNINTGNPPDFWGMRGLNIWAFDNTTQGWIKTNWEELESYKKVKVCKDGDLICESEVR